MASNSDYQPVGGSDPLDKEETQDIELQDELHASQSWPQRKAQFLDSTRAPLFGSTTQRLRGALEHCQLPAKLATVLVLVLSMSTGFLLLYSNRASSAPTTASSFPQLINDTPWDRLMSGLDKAAYVDSEQYPRSLEQDLLILDVDTRPWEKENPANLSSLTWGRLNHYLYAKIHGYDYKYVQAPEPPETLHYTWAKVTAIRELLKSDYKFIVFLDSDAVFPHLKIPMEYLIDYWNVTSEIAIAMGLAQPDKNNHDRFQGKQTANTGFMIMQNIPEAHQLFKDWEECPTDIKYKDCSHWGKVRLHEQNAYSDYIRYDYADHVRELTCNEVNGGPQHKMKGKKHCGGQLVRHLWMAKPEIQEAVERSIAEIFMPGMVRELTAKWIEHT